MVASEGAHAAPIATSPIGADAGHRGSYHPLAPNPACPQLEPALIARCFELRLGRPARR